MGFGEPSFKKIILGYYVLMLKAMLTHIRGFRRELRVHSHCPIRSVNKDCRLWP